MSMRRDYVASTSIRRHYGTKCPLGCVNWSFIFFLQYSQAAKEKVGFALYGLGRIGQIHIENLLSNNRVELRWLVEENSALVEEVTTQYGLKGKVKQANLEEIPKMLADKRYGFGNHPGFL